MHQQMSASEHYEHGLVLKRVEMFYPAIEDFQQAALDPQCAGKAHVQMALCLRSAGRHEEAVMAFRQALASPIFSSEERRHILYQMGQTLESLGRYAESLEVYGWIRKEAPGFQDVAQRIKHLSSGGRGPVPRSQGQWLGWMEGVLTCGRQLKPHVVSFFEQTGEWLVRRAEDLKTHRLFQRNGPDSSSAVRQRAHQALTPKRRTQPALRDRTTESRRHVLVPVRLRSCFSSKARTVTGEGMLRDLSPWGCRVTSPVPVHVGADLECCIFPQDAANPFIIDGATVRWISPREFGLAFTNVRPGVQRQIAQLCRTQAA
ncbi:MAG: PilZ domain-containing protein [Nitrospirae bacterium]|nr:PilZ domain-containing protein [Nitrospirota bacterium]